MFAYIHIEVILSWILQHVVLSQYLLLAKNPHQVDILLVLPNIRFIETCDIEEIKATDCIIKFFITSGNIKWRSFALRFCASNPESAWQPLLPSAKGLSFILVVYLMQESWWSSPFLFTFYPLASTLCWKDSDIYIYIQLDVRHHELLLLTLPLR